MRSRSSRLGGGAGATGGAAQKTGEARGIGAGGVGRAAEQVRAAGSTEGMDTEVLLGWDAGLRRSVRTGRTSCVQHFFFRNFRNFF
jgi:hypothetical protein